MKTINRYINEKLVIGDNLDNGYNYHPKTKDELVDCIKEKIEKEGLGTKETPLDLNDINTSEITDMSNLFNSVDGKLKELSENGYFDISDWDVSNVKDMKYMFYFSVFDGDLSKWNVRNVEDMYAMFYYSSFGGNISDWDVSNVEDMRLMFGSCKKFNCDLNKWNIKSIKYYNNMFIRCPLENNSPKWYHENN